MLTEIPGNLEQDSGSASEKINGGKAQLRAHLKAGFTQMKAAPAVSTIRTGTLRWVPNATLG
jgi:hypothetical protein